MSGAGVYKRKAAAGPCAMPVPVRQVVAYIEAHLDQIEGVEDIASDFGISLETLRQVFRREVGRTLGAYLTQQRVALASSLSD